MAAITSDFLNPMLVRDLRQGLRSSRFTIVFLLLQVCMAFFVAMGLLSGQGSEVGRALTHSLMVALILFYLLGLPMAATFSFWAEFSENRIDLLKLTQMSARSLVWGKWFSLFLQGLMVFVSLLPYLILTYFFGQVDLGKEMFELSIIFGLGTLLLGGCVMISCYRSGVFQVLIILGLLWLTWLALQMVDDLQAWGLGSNQRGGSAPALITFVWENPGVAAWLFVLVGLPVLWLLMEYGAARLAPVSENHDTPQRLVLIALIAVAGLSMVFDMMFPGTFVDNFTDRFFYFGGWVGAVVLMFAASSEPSPYPDSYRPFVRFGFPGKFIGRAFLYPGWPSATPFILLVTAFFSLLATEWCSFRQIALSDGWFIPFLLLPPALLFPQLVGWLVLGRTRLQSSTRYFTVMVFCLMVYIACALLYRATQNRAFVIAAGVLPPDAWILFASGRLSADAVDTSLLFTMKMLATISGGLTMAIMCLRSLWQAKKTMHLEKRAASSLRSKRAPRLAPEPTAGNPTRV